jgi:hypothetical protein
MCRVAALLPLVSGGFVMLRHAALLLVACACLALSFAGRAEEKKPTRDHSEAAVRLRLNAVEYGILLDRYEMLLKRELAQKDSLRLYSPATRAKQENSLKETQVALEAVRKQAGELESERLKLLRTLGKVQEAAPLESDRILKKILERLVSIEKRLEKMDKPK